MKAMLEFDLSEQEQREEHLRCIKSTDMALCLWEIRGDIRDYLERLKITSWKQDKIIEFINDKMYERNIKLDELIT